MSSHKSLSLPHRLESPHPSLPEPRRLMGLLCPVILILLSAVDRIGNQLTMCHSITTQFVGNDFPGFAAIVSYKAPEETFCSSPVTFFLQIHVNHFTVLICRSPQVMLLAVDLNGNFIDVERVAVASEFSFQSTGVRAPNLIHQRRIASRLTVMPRSASRSSMSLWLRLKR